MDKIEWKEIYGVRDPVASDNEINNYLLNQATRCEKGQYSWESYYTGLLNYWEYDSFGLSSADRNNPILTRFEGYKPVSNTELQLVNKIFTEDWEVKNHARFVKDLVKYNWYVSVGFTGGAAYRRVNNVDISGLM